MPTGCELIIRDWIMARMDALFGIDRATPPSAPQDSPSLGA
jgi:hypothetical protein